MANAINFSRHYSSRYPELNLATYRGESPLGLFIGTVPGVTGVLMVVLLALLGITSNRWARRRNYDVFFYTHYLGLLFLLLLLVHPLSGVLKEQKNLHGHIPGCQMYGGSNTDGEGFPEPEPVASYSHLNHSFTNLVKRGRGSHHTPQHRSHSAATHSETGYPESDPDYGFPEPDPDYIYPEPDPDYGFPEPDPNYGFPEPDPVYGFPKPDADYGFPEPDIDYGNLEYEPYSGYSKPYIDHGSHDSEYENGNSVKWLHSADKELSKERDSSAKTQREIHRQQTWRKHRKCLKAPIFGSINSQTWLWVGVSLIVWAADWAVRRWRRRADVQIIDVVHHPCDVVQVTLKQPGFSCIPGQYVLVQCPKVSRMEWHPFTVTSPLTQQSPDTFTIFMRVRGDWSSRVATLLHSDKSMIQQTHTVQWPESDSHRNCRSSIPSSPSSISSPLIQSSRLTCSNFSSQSLSYPHPCSCNKSVFSHLPHCAQNDLHMHTMNELSDHSFLPGEFQNKDLSFSKRKYLLTKNSQIYSKSDLHSSSEKDRLSSPNSCLPLIKTYRHLRMSQSRRLHQYPEKQFLQQQNVSKGTDCHSHHISVDAAGEVYSPNTSKIQACIQVGSSQPDIHTVSSMNHLCDSLWKLTSHPQSSSKYHPQLSSKWSSHSENENSTQDGNHQIIHITSAPNVRLLVDGPFSSPSEDMLHYPVVIGAAGGVGITPLASTLSHILWCASPWPKRVHVVWVVRDARLFVALAPLLSSLLLHCWNTHTEDRIELRLHVTTPTSHELLQELFAEEHPGLLPRITQGRPVWKHLFQEWHQAYLGDKVGVFACGPAKMCRQVKWHCLSSVSRGAPFHYHQESFS
ncbi:NADPH oxidase 4-like isoform X2 [Panulirus ornatus]